MLHHIYNRRGKENITSIKKELSDGVLYLILIYYQNCQDKLRWRCEDGKLERTDLNLPVAMKGHSSHHVFSIKQLNFFCFYNNHGSYLSQKDLNYVSSPY